MFRVLALLLLLAVPAVAQVGQGYSPSPGLSATGDASATTSLATGGTASPATTNAARFAERLNLMADYGAKGDAITLGDGVISAGTTAFSSATATFTQADAHKKILINGAGAAGAVLSTTIATVVDANHITLAATAGTSTPWWRANGAQPIVTGVSASYAPGEVVTLAGGVPVTAAQLTLKVTKLVSATVQAGGSGGTTGSCTLTGTTGTALAGLPFTVTGTVAAGAISGALVVASPGYYTANPTLSAVPVTGCGLTGATLNLLMGPADAVLSATGQYTTAPPATTGQASTTGSGAGATWLITWVAYGGEFTYGTDDTTALAGAITALNTLAGSSSGVNVPRTIYAASGNYLIDGAALPAFFRNGGIVGDGTKKTLFTIGSDYSGDIFSWSEAWNSTDLSDTSGSIITGIQKLGPTIKGFSIYGNRSSPNTQNAFTFYDRDDEVTVDDIDVFNLPGRVLYSGVTKATTQSYMRESHNLTNLRFRACGAPGLPVIEFNSQGTGDATNEIDLTNVDIYDPRAAALVIRSNGNPIGLIKVVHFRVEGQEYNTNGVADDLVRIGDSTLTGIVGTVTFENSIFLDPFLGFSAIRLTAPSAASQPFQIVFDNSVIGGGTPFGRGISVDAGKSSTFIFPSMFSLDYNVNVASSTTTALPLTFSGYGAEAQWTWNVDSTATGYTRSPVQRSGAPTAQSATTFTSVQIPDGTVNGGNVRGANSTDWQTVRFGATQVASSTGSTIGGGRNNTAANTDATCAGGNQNTCSGFTSAVGGGAGNVANSNFGTIPGGIDGSTLGQVGLLAFASGQFAIPGDSELGMAVLRGSTTSTTPLRLTTNAAAATTINTLNPALNSAWQIDLDCQYRDTVSAAIATWYWKAVLLSVGSSAATTAVAAPAATNGQTSGSPGATAPAIAADTTNGGLSVTFTAPNSDLSHITCRAHAVIMK